MQAEAMERSTMPRVCSRIPWYFQTARRRIAANRRGGFLMLRWIGRLGLLDRCAPFPLSDRESVIMPLGWPLLWREDIFTTYEPDAIASFAAAVEEMAQPAFLIDCGADVGLFTRLVLLQTHNIARIVAFEPNPRSYQILQSNFSGLSVPAHALQAGVGAAAGFATFGSLPPGMEYPDHSNYLQPADQGIPVQSIDSLGIPPGSSVALKIDVEGAEMDALKGARNTLTAASDFVVQIEAHRDVMDRTGVDPIEFLRAVCEMVPADCAAYEEVSRLSYPNIEPGRSFFDQVGDREHRVLDMVIRRRKTSRPSKSALR